MALLSNPIGQGELGLDAVANTAWATYGPALTAFGVSIYQTYLNAQASAYRFIGSEFGQAVIFGSQGNAEGNYLESAPTTGAYASRLITLNAVNLAKNFYCVDNPNPSAEVTQTASNAYQFFGGKSFWEYLKEH